jgi:hypothetical protein
MRKKHFTLFLILYSLFCSVAAFGQHDGTLTGLVLDNVTQKPVANAAIVVAGSPVGSTSDSSGKFIMNLKPGAYDVEVSHLSYQSYKITCRIEEYKVLDAGNVFLVPFSVSLNEVSIISFYITDRKTPVAVTTIESALIEKQTGNKDYPELLNQTPGIYATKQGGGSGDDRLTIRGFQQENIALLLNGVPVSSMENGLVYWSNWMGLTDATESIQVQRGLGASKVAMNSVGGTINIITKTTSAEKGGFFRCGMSEYGNSKMSLQLSTGRMKNGFSMTFLGSRTTGPGYVDGTYVDGWAYFLSLAYDASPKHKFVLTALGSPEKHGQKNYGSTAETIEKYGVKYNSEWGMYNGKVLNLSENFYHKPQFNLNHYWSINEKMMLASSAYVSFGYGGGRYSEAFNYGTPTYYFRKNNQIDFDAVFLNNFSNQDSSQLADGTWMKGYSKNILTLYKADHYWAGLLSTFHYDMNPNLKIMTGIHARTFRSRLYEEVNDLMGGQYWIEQYAWSLAGVAGRQQVKSVGDVINVDNYSIMQYGNLFAQADYIAGKFNLFFASTVSGTGYQRKDPYNYPEDPFSKYVFKTGFDTKAGLNYSAGNHNNLYINIGFYSREPLFKFVFVDYSNAIATNLVNEKIRAAEAGYSYQNGKSSVRLNGYITDWRDKSLLSRENVQLADSTLTRTLVRGLNALHIGLELEAATEPVRNLRMGMTMSLGNWKWKNNVSASIYDDNHVLVEDMKVYAKGLYVGDAPQTQLGLHLEYKFFQDFDLVADWTYYDRLYANFDPATRTNPEDLQQPYRLPAYSISDFYLGYDFNINKLQSRLQLSCQNVFNKITQVRGDDGMDHTLETFTGFWTMERNFNVSLKMAF